jgi:hypothetical protein
MRPFLVAVCLIGISPCIAQSTKVDSLFQLLKKAKEDTVKVELYTDLTFTYFFGKPDSAYYFAQLGEELAAGNARLYFKEGKRDSALIYAYRALGTAVRYHLNARELDADKFICSVWSPSISRWKAG